jgi:hypothetical protein
LPSSSSLSRAGNVNSSSCVPLLRSLLHVPIVIAAVNSTAIHGNVRLSKSSVARLSRKNSPGSSKAATESSTNKQMNT